MPQTGLLRYEIKFHAEPHHLHQIHAWVRLHPAHWRVTYPPRQVNNIYFDTEDYQSLNDNLSGVGTRRKLRLRWYGPAHGCVAGAHLELKCKDGLVGWKESWPLEHVSLGLDCQPWPGLCRALREAVAGPARLWMAQFPRPVLINHYRRAYYATADRAVRLTVDYELRVFDQRLSDRPNLCRASPVAERVIVELKAGHQHYSRLRQLIAQFPARTERYSKYVQGMLAATDFNRLELL